MVIRLKKDGQEHAERERVLPGEEERKNSRDYYIL
jgi:hypothetical protein